MNTVKAWTDYPMKELGDVAGKKAPIREIEVCTYDRDKYCWVKVVGTEHFENIKAGYIYTEAGRCGEVPMVPTSTYNQLPDMFEDEE